MTKKEVEQLIVNGKLTLITDCIACGKILLLHITQMNELGEDVLVCPKVKDSLFSIYKEETVYKRIEGLLVPAASIT